MPIPDLTSLGLRLRHARKLRKLIQPDLARAAGIKQPSLSELETGETKEISGPTLIALAAVLKVRPEWLVTGKGPMEQLDEPLADDERDLLANYRSASPRWKVSLRYMAQLRGDAAQDEAAGSMNIVLAKIAATPVDDQRVVEALKTSRHGFPPGASSQSVHEPDAARYTKREPLFRSRDEAHTSGHKGKKDRRFTG